MGRTRTPATRAPLGSLPPASATRTPASSWALASCSSRCAGPGRAPTRILGLLPGSRWLVERTSAGASCLGAGDSTACAGAGHPEVRPGRRDAALPDGQGPDPADHRRHRCRRRHLQVCPRACTRVDPSPQAAWAAATSTRPAECHCTPAIATSSLSLGLARAGPTCLSCGQGHGVHGHCHRGHEHGGAHDHLQHGRRGRWQERCAASRPCWRRVRTRQPGRPPRCVTARAAHCSPACPAAPRLCWHLHAPAEAAGAPAGTCPTDATTLDYVTQRTDAPFEPVHADASASYLEEYRIDVSRLQPLVAAPHSPDNRKTAAECSGTPIDRVYIG